MAVWGLRLYAPIITTLFFHFSLTYNNIYYEAGHYTHYSLINKSAGLSKAANNYLYGRRVTGGYEVNRGQIPYQAALQHLEDGFQTFCGGSVISRYWILTAAHCVGSKQSNNVYALVGTTYLANGGYRYLIRKIVLHPNHRKNRNSDLALLKTKKMFFNKDVHSIHIQPRTNYTGMSCVISGWGTLDRYATIPTTRLRALMVNVLDRKHCIKLSNGQYSERHKDMLCSITLDKKEDMCNGDSGGPLVCNNALVGVVSFGSMPCALGFPMFSVNLYHNWAWMKNLTKDWNIFKLPIPNEKH